MQSAENPALSLAIPLNIVADELFDIAGFVRLIFQPFNYIRVGVIYHSD
jgi:hypothetical protein